MAIQTSFDTLTRAAHCTVWLVACWLLADADFQTLVAAEPADRTASVANDWPQWRGPQGRATLAASQLPDPWPTAPPKRLWQARLGSGWSSPVVADGRVYVTDRAAARERVLAFDAATGRELWNRAHDVDFDPHAVGRRHGNGPKATPLVNDGRVYAVGIAGWLDCLRAADGQVVWQVNYPAEFGAREPLSSGRATVNGTENVIVPIGKGQGAPVPLFGYTGSPALWQDFLIAPVGGRRGGTIMAFHKDTGRVAWKALDENVSYSSPVVAEIGGVPQVVVMTGPRVVGLSAADGAVLWSHPFQIQYDESISTPVVGRDTVVVTATGRPATALRIRRAGDTWQKQVAWTNEILSSYLSSMVTDGEVLYGMNDGGEFSCLRLADGKTLWTGGNHGYYASPILSGKRLLALNDRGMLALLAADPAAYKELGACRLATSETWTMPAIVGSRIYVRSADGLACFETRP
ncbi:MAG: PQQ-like beta-propeller repeat protein [Planctomycetia bacterium]|nr:PQQ-like beta-propeller repeat protein [Planctomycetia bacterium]